MQLKYRLHVLKVCCTRLVVTMVPVDIASAAWSVTVRSWINGCQLLTCPVEEAERVKFIISSKGSPNSRTFEWREHITTLQSRLMELHSWYFGLFISCCIAPWMHPEIPLLQGTAERWRNLFITSMNLCLCNPGQNVCRFVYLLSHLIILRLDYKPWNSILDYCWNFHLIKRIEICFTNCRVIAGAVI